MFQGLSSATAMMQLAGFLFGLTALGMASSASNTNSWRPVLDKSLSISAGNILDFSGIRGSGYNGQGPMLCASQPFGIEGGFPDHATADVYARQLRRHGYILARFHFLENVLMGGRTQDFDFDPEQLDRLHYFLAALKREGIAWMMDGLTAWNGAYGDVGTNRWVKKHNLKVGIYYDPAQQAHWKELVRRLLGTRNRYTGKTILEDPALYGVILVNEGGLNHVVNLDPDPALDRLFERWLVKRYGSLDSVWEAWGSFGPKDGRISLPRRIWTATPWVRDAQRFYYDTQRDAYAWMQEYIRSLGYTGLITAFDSWPNLQDQAIRAPLQWVDMHAYHEEPSRFVEPGSRIGQTSSLVEGLEYVRHLATARYWSKPYSVSEYGHPFWSRWRFQSGLAVSAYAALQGWDLICRHGSGPIELAYGQGNTSRRRAIYPYGIGMDPVERANETLAALLYLRGDVSPAKHRVGIRLSENYVFDKRGGIGRLPVSLTELGLITGVGLVWDTQPAGAGLDALLEPDGKLPTLANKLAARVGLSGEQSFSSLLTHLKGQGLLEGNSSDGENHFVSDTGEIILEPTNNSLKVITKRTEAAAFETAPGRLSLLSIDKASVPALVAASSMDGRDLAQSTRILLIVATDARNSGMQFADDDERELKALGTLPILLRAVQIDMRLRRASQSNLSLYALHLNGERAEKIPLTSDSDGVIVKLDTSRLTHGPTTFFELVIE